MRLAVFGLGKLGLCTAACFAARGHQVLGYDLNPNIRQAVAAGECPVPEPGLPELLAEARGRLQVCAQPAEAAEASDLSLIIVPTPSQGDGRFSNRAVEAVLAAIGPVLARKRDFHVVDVVSTVMPGSSQKRFWPQLEQLSGKRCGRDFGLAYNPEFIALGSVIANFLNPDLVLVGASDGRTGELLRQLYLSTCDNEPHIAVMSLINAEIAKLSLNCYITMKISFANELAGLCERVPGADVDEVTRALGADSRIGAKYLKGGLGFGGPCFPRDNLAFQAFAREFGWTPRLSPQVVAVNEAQTARLSGIIRRAVPAPGPVALLGLSYKPDTHVVEESPGLKLAQALVAAGYAVRVHDPAALAEARHFLGDAVSYWEDPVVAVEGAEAVALLTRWPQYADLPWECLGGNNGTRPLLLDSWRLLKGKPLPHFHYRALGTGPVAEAAP